MRLGRRLISTVEVRAMVNHSHVAEGNCVAMRRGGEQPEAKWWSVGERTRFGGMLATSLLIHSLKLTDPVAVVDKTRVRRITWLGTEHQEG